MRITKRIILASASPRRQLLLRQIGLTFDVAPSGVSEELEVTIPPREYVKILAERKARSVAAGIKDGIVIGADTIVVYESKLLGKPRNADDAAAMLQMLSGKMHEVFTGFALVDRPSDKSVSGAEMTKVKFRTLSSQEIDEYVASGSPMDKAGAYGIQDDYGAVFVERVEGCFYNVMGFPLTRFFISYQEFQKQLGLL